MTSKTNLEQLKTDPLINDRHDFRAACALQALLTKHGHAYQVELVGQIKHHGEVIVYGNVDGWLRIILSDVANDEFYELGIFNAYTLIGALETAEPEDHEFIINEVMTMASEPSASLKRLADEDQIAFETIAILADLIVDDVHEKGRLPDDTSTIELAEFLMDGLSMMRAYKQKTRATAMSKVASTTICPPRSNQAERNRKKARRKARRSG